MNDLLLEQAFALRNVGDGAQAERLYLQCLESAPENAEALRELGLIQYGRRQDFQKAKKLIEQSLAVEDCPDGRLYLALVLDEIGLKKEAEENFKEALEQSKNDVIVGVTYANFLAENERLEEAEEHFKAALLKDPDCEYAQKNYRDLVAFRAREHELNQPTKSGNPNGTTPPTTSPTPPAPRP